MQEERKIRGTIAEATFGFGGTEYIPSEKLMQLTEGKSIEIIAKGEGVRIIIHLMALPKGNPYKFYGAFHVEEKRYVDERDDEGRM